MRARALSVALTLLVVAVPAAAQVEIGVGAGLAYPGRDFGATAKLGTIAIASVMYRIGEGPVALRLDGEYAELQGKDAPTFVYPRHRVRAMRLSGEYEYDGSDEESRWRAWGFGGIGAFYDEVDRGVPEIPPFGRTHFGLQFGLGGAYKVGALKPFVELQYQTILERGINTKIFPLTVGVRLWGR
jgi:hypothetical protein